MLLVGLVHLTCHIFNLGQFPVFQRKVNLVYLSLVAKLDLKGEEKLFLHQHS